MSHGHIGESAALYALGALDQDERSAIEAHVRACRRCAQSLGAAERDVTLAASMEVGSVAPPQLASRIDATLARETAAARARPRFPLQLVAGLAAALIVAVLPSAYLWQENRALHATMVTQTAAMQRLASTPHRTAIFRGMKEHGTARVMYAADGSWYVVLVEDISKTLRVAWMHGGEQTTLGAVVPHGDVAILYLPKSHRMDQLALMDGDRMVALAQLTY